MTTGRRTGYLRGGMMVFVLVGACDLTGLLLPPGSRQLVIPVTNDSPGVATLEVTNDNPAHTLRVGNANPGVVAPSATIEVTFTLPDTNQWAIVVNGQTLIIPQDVAGHSGRLPIQIFVSADGSSGWSSRGNWP